MTTEQYIIIGLSVVLIAVTVYFWFHGKKEKIKEVIRRTMVVARIYLHSEDGQKKEAFVIESIRNSIVALGSKAPIFSKILLYFLTEKRIKNIIEKLAPDVKSEVKGVVDKTINTVATTALNTATSKIINMGVGVEGLDKFVVGTSSVIDLANVLKTTDEDTGLVSAIATYTTDFEDKKELMASLGFVKKF